VDGSTFVRTKTKEGITTERTYTLGEKLGSGLFADVFRLNPLDPTQRSKAGKMCVPKSPFKGTLVPCPSLKPVKHVWFKEDCSIEKEHATLQTIHSCLSDEPGLPSAPKAIFPHDTEKDLPAFMILKLYDFDFSRSSEKVKSLSFNDLLDASQQLTAGLKALHSKNIVHGDIGIAHLCGGNVMYDVNKKKAVVIDFGLASLPTAYYTPSEERRVEDVEGLGGTLFWPFHVKIRSLPYLELRKYLEFRTSLETVFKEKTAEKMLDGVESARAVYERAVGLEPKNLDSQ
jgi:serine/threonine protein kinase